MGHSVGDGIIVAALAGLFFGYLYLRFRTRIKRLELIHQERLQAMEKDFPLPELPVAPPLVRNPPNPHVPLILGVVLVMFGAGSMVALYFSAAEQIQKLWVAPMPVLFIGVGLILVYGLINLNGAKRGVR